MKILHLDSNHPLLQEQLTALGFTNHEDFTSSKEVVAEKIANYDGLVIRSRFSIDAAFLDQATRLQFIARVGAGLENIDIDYAAKKNIHLIAAPEGNSNAVGEHSLALLLSLFNKIPVANEQIRNGHWLREDNRGVELDGKTVGLIGYGNMGKAFAKKLRGFNVAVLCYDIQAGVGDANCTQVSLEEFQKRVQIVSLHTPQTPSTEKMICRNFIQGFTHPFWLINTARGKAVITKDLLEALENKRILGAGLDVLEYEKTSFENLFSSKKIPTDFHKLVQSEKVILSPHVAGWTVESKQKLAQTIVSKIAAHYKL